MQSSYNVIKNNSIKNTGNREIVTMDEAGAIKAESEALAKSHIESYESLAKSILENARRKKEQILIKAYEEAKNIEEDALIRAEQLKNEAFELGHSEGYSVAYDETMKQAKLEGEAIVASAMNLLESAKAEYEAYLQSKEKDIKDLVLTIANTVLRKEIEAEDSINSMIYEALEASKRSKNFIIRCNSRHTSELKKQSKDWKAKLGFTGDIFIVEDNSLEAGNAVIDKGNGKVIVGIDYALQRLEEILEERE